MGQLRPTWKKFDEVSLCYRKEWYLYYLKSYYLNLKVC